MPAALRLGEFVATLSLAQDNAFGQPLESQLRSCLLASWISGEAGLGQAERDTIYWVALLRYVGCTGHAHEVATVFGDEIAIRAQTLVHDAANPAEVMRDVVAFATVGRTPGECDQIISMIQQTAQQWAVHNFASGCEVADMLVRRLDFGPSGRDVRDALRFTFERWNGNGFPSHVHGEAIPRAMRVVHLSHDMEAIARIFSPAKAVDAAGERRGRTYDPALADLFVAHGQRWLELLATLDPWDAVLALEPEPHQLLEGAALDHALTVAADFIDLKSAYMGGHSRRCAELSSDAGRRLGLSTADVSIVRRAALVHDFGTTGVSNSILDKRGTLTRAEFDRVELHPMLTEQMLRRSPALMALSPVASAHHEKCDGSGYHKRVHADANNVGACVLAATEVYVGMTTERADRPAFNRGRDRRGVTASRVPRDTGAEGDGRGACRRRPWRISRAGAASPREPRRAVSARGRRPRLGGARAHSDERAGGERGDQIEHHVAHVGQERMHASC